MKCRKKEKEMQKERKHAPNTMFRFLMYSHGRAHIPPENAGDRFRTASFSEDENKTELLIKLNLKKRCFANATATLRRLKWKIIGDG